MSKHCGSRKITGRDTPKPIKEVRMEKMNWFSHAGLAVVCALFLVLSFGCAGTMTGGKSQAAITILMLCFLGYDLFGENIPGMFGHAGFSGEEILYQLFLMSEGIWGLLTDMTSRLIALFVLFGPVLFATGVGKTFMGIAMLSGGQIRGGAGHVSVIGISFFGMLSGSSVANVATTGSFTIPTM